MLRKPAVSTNVKLILANVEDRVEAPIGVGYFMIGRHEECQIRPRSKSVSARHCLLEHRAGLVRVFDLESKKGTFVNGNQLKPHTWCFLADGDQLRCGKLEFQVVINKQINERPDPSPAAAERPASPSVPSATTHNHVASSNASSTDASPRPDLNASDKVDSDLDSLFSDDDDAVFEQEDADDPSSAAEEVTSTESRTGDDELDDLFDDDDAGETSSPSEKVEPQTKPEESPESEKSSATKRRVKPVKAVNVPKVSKSSGGSSSFSMPSIDFGNPESLKLVGALAIALATIGYFGYQVINISSPAPTRIIQEDIAP